MAVFYVCARRTRVFDKLLCVIKGVIKSHVWSTIHVRGDVKSRQCRVKMCSARLLCDSCLNIFWGKKMTCS